MWTGGCDTRRFFKSVNYILLVPKSFVFLRLVQQSPSSRPNDDCEEGHEEDSNWMSDFQLARVLHGGRMFTWGRGEEEKKKKMSHNRIIALKPSSSAFMFIPEMF